MIAGAIAILAIGAVAAIVDGPPGGETSQVAEENAVVTVEETGATRLAESAEGQAFKPIKRQTEDILKGRQPLSSLTQERRRIGATFTATWRTVHRESSWPKPDCIILSERAILKTVASQSRPPFQTLYAR